MKPNNDDSAQDAAAETQSFAEALKSVDVSSLDRLIAIRQDNAKLAAYRAKAEEKKKDVTDAVYARVSQDYAKRAASLEAQSAPLRTQARTEYRKLKALLDVLGGRQDAAQLEKDELQFRHEVGELNDGELAAKLVDPQRVLDQCARDRKDLDASKARFVEALGSEKELETVEPPPAPPRPPAPPAAPPKDAVAATPPQSAAPAPAPATAPAPAAAPPAAKAAAPSPAAAAAKPPVEDPGETRVARPMADADQATRITSGGGPQAQKAAAAPAPQAAAPAKPAAADDDASDGATLMLATAAVVVDGPGGKEYPLSVLNGIGRAEDNRICLSSPGISRKHAVITAASGGFMIKDLGSQNGTFVNGQRITEKKLAEGDTIEVGSVKFAFRTPWPPRGGAAAARGEAAAQGKR